LKPADDVVVGTDREMSVALDASALLPTSISASSRKAAPAGGPPCWAPRSATAKGRFRRALREALCDSSPGRGHQAPPGGYKTRLSICRKLSSEHAQRKAESEMPGKPTQRLGPAQMCKKRRSSQGKGHHHSGEDQGQLGLPSCPRIDSNEREGAADAVGKTATSGGISCASTTAPTKRPRETPPYILSLPLPPHPTSLPFLLFLFPSFLFTLGTVLLLVFDDVPYLPIFSLRV